jgi:hypothetical protein
MLTALKKMADISSVRLIIFSCDAQLKQWMHLDGVVFS